MTADPRPAPPEHADRDAQKLDLGTIIYEHMERAGATLMWELADAILAAGFARTPESASGTTEPVVWAIQDNTGAIGRPTLEYGELSEVVKYANSEDADIDEIERQPHTIVPLYLHPTSPPSVRDTPSPEGGT